MQAGSLTITDAVWPRVGLWRQDAVRDMVLMMGFAWFVALCAQIAIRLPWTTVPITGQTFAVLVTGGALGAWRGAGALTVYMLMGMIYIPGVRSRRKGNLRDLGRPLHLPLERL